MLAHRAIERIGLELREGSFLCPAHNDTRPSLSIKQGDDGKWLVWCHAGCSTADVLAAAGWTWDQVMGSQAKGGINDIYTYQDEQGQPLTRKLRGENKEFFQQHWDGQAWALTLGSARRVLYRLPELLKASGKVFVVEGERDVETLRAQGLTATTSGSAKSWRPEFGEQLRHLSPIILMGDNDGAGREAVEAIGQSLRAASLEFKIAFPPDGYKDVTDMYDAGLTILDLVGDIEEPWHIRPLGDDAKLMDYNWLLYPFVAKGTHSLWVGPSGVGKSMLYYYTAKALIDKGHRVVVFDEENPAATTISRRNRFGLNAETLTVYHDQGINLREDRFVTEVVRAARESRADLLVFDSYERIWPSGHDKSEDSRYQEFVTVLKHISRQCDGAATFVIDHTGWGETDRPRYASSKEQQSDMWVTVGARGVWVKGKPFPFAIQNRKAGRLGNPFQATGELYDTATGGLDIRWTPSSLHDQEPEAMTSEERRALARIRDTFKVQDGEPDVL